MGTQRDMQAEFLSTLMDEQVQVAIFLISGIKLCGRIIGFDSFIVQLAHDNQRQMIYKHAISTIMPEKALQQHHKAD